MTNFSKTVGRRDPSRSLFFLHVAKTGGTSLVTALRRLYPEDRQFHDHGDVTVEYLEALGEAAFAGGFIYGHPRRGSAAFLGDRVDTITILRRPVDQAISRYLHIRKSPASWQYETANRSSFADFLRQHPFMIAYQTLEIAVAVDGIEFRKLETFAARAEGARRFLRSVAFVGLLERSAENCAFLGRYLGLGHALHLPRINTAAARGDDEATIAALRAEYEELRLSGEFADLFAAEAELYALATELMEARLDAYGVSSPDQNIDARPGRALRIPAASFSCPDGALEDGRYVCSLANCGPHPVFGPYDYLDEGDYEVEFHFTTRDLTSASSCAIELDAVAAGGAVLSRRLIRNPASPLASPHTLLFHNDNAADLLEFRIGKRACEGGVLEFSGVSIRRLAGREAGPVMSEA